MPHHLKRFPLDPKLPLDESCSAAAEQLFFDVCFFHDEAVERYGGLPEIRDENMLRSAAARPFTVIMGEFQYETGLDQAGALLQSIAQNHGFNDANKRSAFTTTL
jgi:death-on-curing protein